jgi:hypothetical protein
MPKELTHTEYHHIADTPRRRFQTLAVTASTVSLHQPVPLPCYWFERNDVVIDGETGRFWRDPARSTISMMVDGKPSVLFYLVGRRLDSCTFAYDLTPAELHKAVTAMHRANLQNLIHPAAEWALRSMPAERRPVLEDALRTLLRAAGAPKPDAPKRRRPRAPTPDPGPTTPAR